MVFTDYNFLLFFVVVFVLYWAIRKHRWQNFLLLAASYYFYGSIQIWYVILLGLSTLVDFFIAGKMPAHPERKSRLIAISLVVNLGVLAFFKYNEFFLGDMLVFLSGLGINADTTVTSILLPAGLSFFTLKKMGYMFDVSRGTLKPTHSLVDFSLYVSFFPQIISGPIDRPQNLLPQIDSQRSWNFDLFFKALPLLVMGWFKKIVIADSLQVLVGRVFSSNDPSGLFLLSGALGFTLQILADFSAYTDMSRGIALLFGFTTPENFRQPYLSISPTDFWNRWHITLSTWLRDYVFFPIQRALMKSQFKAGRFVVTVIPPMATMLISGMWHGAHLNFILWGLYWGVLIVLYQSLGIRGDWRPASRLTLILAWSIMFFLIVFSWAIFRAPSTDWLIHALRIAFLRPSQGEFIFSLIILTTVFAYAIPLIVHALLERYAKESWWQAIFQAVVVALIIVYANSAEADFIYFQF